MQGQGAQGQHADDLGGEAQHHQLSPVVAIRRLAGHEGQGEHRDELDEADHADQQGALLDADMVLAGDGIDRASRWSRSRRAAARLRQDAAPPEQRKVAMTEDAGGRRDGRVHGAGATYGPEAVAQSAVTRISFDGGVAGPYRRLPIDGEGPEVDATPATNGPGGPQLTLRPERGPPREEPGRISCFPLAPASETVMTLLSAERPARRSTASPSGPNSWATPP